MTAHNAIYLTESVEELRQQETRELLARPAQRMHRVETGAHQIAHRLVPGIRNPHRGRLARPVQPRQTGRIPPIGLDPVARPLRDQRRRHHNAFVPVRRQVTRLVPFGSLPELGAAVVDGLDLLVHNYVESGLCVVAWLSSV